jgi:DNA polymerase III subunit delta
MTNTPNFYLLYGNDDMSLEDALKQLRASMGSGTEAEMNTSEYDGEEVSVPKILNDVRSYPFLSDKRLVIVKGLVSHLMKNQAGKDQLETLLDAVPTLPPHARLVLVERENLKSNLRVVKLAQDKGYCKQFTAPEDISDWIKKRAKSDYQAEIEMQAAHALASVTGNDLRRADNELVKLVSYVDGERPITEQDVALLTPYVAEASVFDMVDALAVGNGRTALSMMNQVLDADPSDPGFRLFSLITRQFRLLLLTREHLDNGGSADKNVLAGVLGIHSYPASKVATQSRRFTLVQLETIYRRVQQYDVEMKTGRIQPRLALELLVASLAK